MDKKLLLIKYILQKCDGGAANLWKIYKLMYYIDFAYYEKNKKSITNANYYNWKYGPAPMNKEEYASSNLIEIGQNDNLWRKIDAITVQIEDHSFNENDFTADEKNVVDKILLIYGGLPSKDLVTLSHEDMPWKMTKEGELIDYEYVFWRDTDEDIIEDITKEIMDVV